MMINNNSDSESSPSGYSGKEELVDQDDSFNPILNKNLRNELDEIQKAIPVYSKESELKK